MRKISGITFDDYRQLNRLLLEGSRLRSRGLAAGALVRAVRARLKMPQRVLAERAGVAQPYLAQIERARVDPKLSTIVRLLDALFCDLVLVPRQRVRLGDALYAQAGRPREFESHRERLMKRPNPGVWKE